MATTTTTIAQSTTAKGTIANNSKPAINLFDSGFHTNLQCPICGKELVHLPFEFGCSDISCPFEFTDIVDLVQKHLKLQTLR